MTAINSGSISLGSSGGGGGVTLVIETGTGAITAGDTADIIESDVSAAISTVTLPLAANHASSSGFLIIKDSEGNSDEYTLTVTGNGGEYIDDWHTKTITTSYSSMTLYSNGTKWRRV